MPENCKDVGHVVQVIGPVCAGRSISRRPCSRIFTRVRITIEVLLYPNHRRNRRVLTNSIWGEAECPAVAYGPTRRHGFAALEKRTTTAQAQVPARAAPRRPRNERSGKPAIN